MSEQFEMNFGAPKKVAEQMPKDENADIDTMDAVTLQGLIESLDQTILSNKEADREFAMELQERRDRAAERLKSLQV